MESTWKAQHALKSFVDPTNFKSYDELKQKLFDVLRGDIRGSGTGSTRTAEDINEEDMKEKKPSIRSKPPVEDQVDEETDALDYFKKLAED